MNSLPRVHGIPPLIGRQSEILRKEVNQNVLHGLSSTPGSDVDDTARASRVQRERKLLEYGTYPGPQTILEHELGRGHRRKRQASTADELDYSTQTMKMAPAGGESFSV